MVRGDSPVENRRLARAWARIAILLMVWIGSAESTHAQLIEITPEPVGSGARALGQSAFIAVADDATAASWNPAGLINLEQPEASLVGAWRSATKDYSVSDPDNLAGPNTWSGYDINFMSYARPLRVGGTDVVVSINYHRAYDFGAEVSGSAFDGDAVFGRESEGSVFAYSAAFGFSIPSRPQLTFGASINWYTQGLCRDYAWKSDEIYTSGVGTPDESTYPSHETYDDFRAHNFTLGLLWDVYEQEENLLTLGLVCHTPFRAEVDYELTGSVSETEPLEMDFPLSLGGGLNYRLSDALSAAFDVEWRNWSEYEVRNQDTGDLKTHSDEDTLAFRLGFEHLWFHDFAEDSAFALRGGLFYETRPAAGVTEPAPFLGFSLGVGWTLKERFSLDLAYQYRWGEDDFDFDGTHYDYELQEHFVVGSVIFYLR